jgi:hypothetical protein
MGDIHDWFGNMLRVYARHVARRCEIPENAPSPPDQKAWQCDLHRCVRDGSDRSATQTNPGKSAGIHAPAFAARSHTGMASPSFSQQFEELADERNLRAFKRWLFQEMQSTALTQAGEPFDADTPSATVPILFVSPDGQGAVANLHLQLVPGSWLYYRHPALAFTSFDEAWHRGIEAAIHSSRMRGEWGRGATACDLIWNVTLQSGSPLPVNKLCGGGSAAAAFDFGLHLLFNPSDLKICSGISLTASLSGDHWTGVTGYLPKLRQAMENACPPVHTVVVAKEDPRSTEFQGLVSGFRILPDGRGYHFEDERRGMTIVEASNLTDALERISYAHQHRRLVMAHWEPPLPKLFAEKETLQRSILKKEKRAEKGKRIIWLSGPPGSGKSTILRLWLESLRQRGKAPASYFCQTNEAVNKLSTNLQDQFRMQIGLDRAPTTDDDSEEIVSPHDGVVLIDGFDQLVGARDLKVATLVDLMKKPGSMWIVSSLNRAEAVGFSRSEVSEITISDLVPPMTLALSMIEGMNSKLPCEDRVPPELIAALQCQKQAPAPLVVQLNFMELEEGRLELRDNPDAWLKLPEELIRERLERLESVFCQHSDEPLDLLLLLALLHEGNSLAFDQETLEALVKGVIGIPFGIFLSRCEWLFQNKTLGFTHPSYARAILELWGTPLRLRRVRLSLADGCYDSLMQWSRARPIPDPTPVQRHILENVAHYLYKAENRGVNWAAVLLNWEFLRCRFRESGAFELLNDFPDNADVAERRGMTGTLFKDVMSLRQVFAEQASFLEARRREFEAQARFL